MIAHYSKPFQPTFGKDDVGTTWAWGWGVGGTGGWGWVLLGFFHNKQDCGGNALSHSIALPLAIDHTHHHYISSYRCFIPLLSPSVVLLIAGVLRASFFLPDAS